MFGSRHAPELPRGPFSVIYADPPWAYRKSALVDRGGARAVEKQYPTMQPSEICALDVGDIAARDSVLFLWATGPKLKIACDVMGAWGFDYKTIAFVWTKTNRKKPTPFVGMGFYTRANAEVVLVGTKGKGLRRKDASVHQVVTSSVEEHSRKPDEVRRRIERLYEGPYVELFARRPAEGWTTWGNEL